MDNESIKEAINTYVREEKSDYAIMLSGEWGTGKTFFVSKELVSFIQENNELDVIYVALFSLESVKELWDVIALIS